MSIEGSEAITGIPYFQSESNEIAFRKNKAWNNVVGKHLSKEQQFSFGARLGFLKYSEKFKSGSTPNDAFLVIRNPEQAPNNIVRHAFGEMVDKNFIPTLYDMLRRKSYMQEDISDEKVLQFVIDNIPEEVFQNFKEYYDQHLKNQEAKVVKKPEETEEQAKQRALKTAKKDFFNLIMFQLVNSQLVEYSRKLNNIDNNPSPEQLSVHTNIPKVLKNVCAEGGKMTYDDKGKLLEVKNGGFGAEIPLLDMMIEKLDKAKPNGLSVEQDKELVDKVSEVVKEANTEFAKLEKTEAYGEYLARDPNFLHAIDSKDPDELNEQFQNVMDLYTTEGALGPTAKRTDEVFKNILNQFVELGCPTAIYYKGQELMGNRQELQRMAAVEMPVFFPRDIKSGLELLSKLEEGAPLVHHVNANNPKTYWSDQDVKSVKDQRTAIDAFIQSLPNLYEEYQGKSTYGKSERKNIQSFLGHLAHKHFSDPKRESQIKLLQNIIDDKSLTQEQKTATLLGAMDAIKNQIGVTKFESRLISLMDKIETGLKESSKVTTGKDMSINKEERNKALSTYLEQKGGSFDKKFVEKIKGDIAPPKPEEKSEKKVKKSSGK